MTIASEALVIAGIGEFQDDIDRIIDPVRHEATRLARRYVLGEELSEKEIEYAKYGNVAMALATAQKIRNISRTGDIINGKDF